MKPRANVLPRGVGAAVPSPRGVRIQPTRMPPPAIRFRTLESIPLSTWALALYVFLFGSLAVEFFVIHSGVRFPVVGAFLIVIFLMYLVSGHPLRFTQTPFFLPWCFLLFWFLMAGA